MSLYLYDLYTLLPIFKIMKSDYEKHLQTAKCCNTCTNFERRGGMYDNGHEQGRCISIRYYVKVIDLCDRYRPK